MHACTNACTCKLENKRLTPFAPMEKENHNPFTPFPEFTQFRDVNLDTKVGITNVRQFL